LSEAVELNKAGKEILSSFGEREFPAMVGFIDMRGFSTAASGKTPAQVRDIAAPFIAAVVKTAAEHECFVDKTIGDEVMVVMPWFDMDTVISDALLPHRQIPEIDLTCLFSDLIKELSGTLPTVKFSAGFSFGSLILDRVGNDKYGEWTVYGNCVNTAKRLQSREVEDRWSENHVIAIGASLAEKPQYEKTLQTWLQIFEPAQAGPLKLISPIICEEEMKGVGQVAFVHSAVEVRQRQNA
jgi:class 3 adenylate cyclase